MKLKEYEQSLTEPLKQATITLLLGENGVLLAMKKRGFGVGKWNGVGGKPNPGEEILAAAIRESEEEIGVTPVDPKLVAELNFYFPQVPSKEGWNQKVLVYITDKWMGDPGETEEMRPKWFGLSEIPYKEMWDDDVIWLPLVLEGKKVKASFLFGEDERLAEHYLMEVENIEEIIL